MFWSKLWFTLLALGAMAVAALALVEGRPVQSVLDADLHARLVAAERSADMVLKIHARKWLDAVAHASSDTQLAEALAESTRSGDKATQLELVHKSAQARLRNFNLEWKIDQLLAVDARGHVLARVGREEETWRDDISGRPVVAEALRGYRLDDNWDRDGQLFHVTASPVIAADHYVGCLLAVEAIDTKLAAHVHDTVGAEVALLLESKVVAQSNSLPILGELPRLATTHAAELERLGHLDPQPLDGGDRSYLVTIATLPGEASLHGASMALVLERPMAPTPLGTLGAITPAMVDPREVGALGGGLLGVLLIGLLFVWLEHDRPLRKLLLSAQALSRSDGDRLDETGHRGRLGSIVRAVNVSLGRVKRGGSPGDSRSVDTLPAGPPRSAGLIEIESADDESRFAPPGAGSSGFASTSEPSERPALGLSLAGDESAALHAAGTPIGDMRTASRDGGPLPSLSVPTHRPSSPSIPLLVLDPASMPIALMPARRPTPSPLLAEERTLDEKGRDAAVPLARLDEMTQLDPTPGRFESPLADPEFDDPPTVQRTARSLGADASEAEFPEIFREFIETKRRCGESVTTLTFEKFATKLRQNRDALVARYSCKRVKFSVYIKDGKAALKANPIN